MVYNVCTFYITIKGIIMLTVDNLATQYEWLCQILSTFQKGISPLITVSMFIGQCQ